MGNEKDASISERIQDEHIERLHRAFLDFKERLDDISHEGDVLLDELRERIKQAEIEKLMKQLKDRKIDT